jgi:hypothetical protein
MNIQNLHKRFYTVLLGTYYKINNNNQINHTHVRLSHQRCWCNIATRWPTRARSRVSEVYTQRDLCSGRLRSGASSGRSGSPWTAIQDQSGRRARSRVAWQGRDPPHAKRCQWAFLPHWCRDPRALACSARQTSGSLGGAGCLVTAQGIPR